jgi:ribosomal protein S18 acetylase RimI-like enzyme
MEIRKLEGKDVIEYQRIRLQSLKENPQYFGSSFEEESKQNLDYFKDRLNQNHTIVYGSFIGSKIVGIIVLVKETRIKTSHIASISAMYVDSTYRRRGIAKTLIQSAIKKAIELKVERIRLSVTQNNTHAIELYKAFGFQIYGIEPRGLKIQNAYFDLLEMNLSLSVK